MTVFIKNKDFDNIMKMVDFYQWYHKLEKKNAEKFWVYPFWNSFICSKITDGMRFIFGGKPT